MALSLSAGAQAAYDEIRSDKTETNFALFRYDHEKKTVIDLYEKGHSENPVHETKMKVVEDDVLYIVLRITHGDRESRRSIFVMVTWVGENTPVMRRAKVPSHKGEIHNLFPGIYIDFFATNLEEFDEEEISKRIKRAMGVDYDTGSNKHGYSSSPTTEYQEQKSPAPAEEKKEEAAPAPAPAPVEEKKEESGKAEEEKKEEATPAPTPAPVEEKKEESSQAEEEKKEEAAPAPVEEKKEEEAAPAPVEEKKKEEAKEEPSAEGEGKAAAEETPAGEETAATEE